ncbi:MAG TPA: methyltransferase domain-containing protein [Aliidiomarina sp.]|nr:methyltransferase domain-containing protein [Aliidiomarina sp.]
MNSLISSEHNVQRAFDRAAHRYYENCYEGQNGSLQKQAAQLLLPLLEGQIHSQGSNYLIDRLVDLGCGMGVHWPALKAFAKHYTGIDLAPKMILEARKRQQAAEKIGNSATTSWLVGDAQALPLANTSADIIFSNLAVQWCNNRKAVANELYRVCKKGGNVYLSTLVSGSLKELYGLKKLGLLRAVNEYPEAANWQQQLERAGFTAVVVKTNTVTTFHTTGSELLRSMKGIGASQVIAAQKEATPQGLRTPKWLKAINTAFEPYQQEQGIPLTYQVALVQARK